MKHRTDDLNGKIKGQKQDYLKLRWDLLPWQQIKEVVKVLTFGATKYSDHNWQHVKDAKRRYFAAAHRHLSDYEAGRLRVKESNCTHLAHCICCLLFLMWGEKKWK